MVKYPSIKCKAYHIVAHNAETVYIFSFVTARIIIGNRKKSFLADVTEIKAVLTRAKIYISILKSSENTIRSTSHNITARGISHKKFLSVLKKDINRNTGANPSQIF